MENLQLLPLQPGLGTIIVEGGYVDDGANEATFAGTIERLEASGELTGKAFEE
jgi:hypothetical protein